MTRFAVDGIDWSAVDAARLPLVAGGVFLQRPELDRYEGRYFPGQRLYFAEVDPCARAQIVVAA